MNKKVYLKICGFLQEFEMEYGVYPTEIYLEDRIILKILRYICFGKLFDIPVKRMNGKSSLCVCLRYFKNNRLFVEYYGL